MGPAQRQLGQEHVGLSIPAGGAGHALVCQLGEELTMHEDPARGHGHARRTVVAGAAQYMAPDQFAAGIDGEHDGLPLRAH